MEVVKIWLFRNGLGEYGPAFEEDGWDDMSLLNEIQDDDLNRLIGKRGHIVKFKKALKHLKSRDHIPITKHSADTTDQSALDIYPAKHETGKSFSEDTFNKKTRTQSRSRSPSKLRRMPIETDAYALQTDGEVNKESSTAKKEIPTEKDSTSLQFSSDICSTHADIRIEKGSRRSIISPLSESEEIDSDQEAVVDIPCTTSMNNTELLLEDKNEPKRDGVKRNLIQREECIYDEKALSTHLSSSIQHVYLHGNPENVICAKTVINEAPNPIAGVNYQHSFKEQMETYVDALRKKDSYYAETSAYRELKDIAEARNWAVLLGANGDGKTATAAHLMFHFISKGYEPVYVKSPHDWKNFVNGSRSKRHVAKQFVLIDDMFGYRSVDERSVGEWLTILEMITTIVDERDGDLVVVCTNKRYVYYDVLSKLTSFKLFRQSSVVDLTQDSWRLKAPEMDRIYANIRQRFNVQEKYDTSIFESLYPPHGFPSCVESFFTNVYLRKNGLTTFLKNPIKMVRDEIANLKENDRTKYCILLFVLFKNNRLSKRYLQKSKSNFTDEDKVIFQNAGVPYDLPYTDIQRSINGLLNIFLDEDEEGTYRCNPCVMDSVAFTYMQDFKLHAIEEMNFEYLVAFTLYPGAIYDSEQTKIVLPEDCTNALVKRITTEIANGNIFAACRHDAWCHTKFVNKWITYVLDNFSSRDVSDEGQCIYTLAIDRTILTKVADNLLEPLIVMKRKLAILALLENETVRKRIENKSTVDNILSYALQIACSSAGNEEIVRILLSKGADATCRDDHGRVLLMLALEDVPNSSYAKILLKDNKLIPKHKDNDGRGYFHYLVNSGASEESFREFCGILINVGEDINLEDKHMSSPLFECVELGQNLKSGNSGFDRFKILIEKGADANIRDSQGRNLVLHVLKHVIRNDACLKYLQYLHEIGVNFNTADNSGKSSLHYLVFRTAAAGNRYRKDCDFNKIFFLLKDRAQVQVSKTDNKGINPLMLALEYCPEYEFVKILLNEAVKHHKDADGRGYFHYLMKSTAADSNFKALCKCLLFIGEDINSKDKLEMPALFLCSESLNISCAVSRLQSLVELGANVHSKDIYGKNLVLLAVEKKAGRYECLTFLNCCKENGVDFSVVDNEGKNVMHYFVFRIGLLSRFLNKECCNKTFYYLSEQTNVNLTCLDNNGRSPLMIALKDCLDFSFVVELLQHIVPKQSDHDGRGYFHYLAKSNASEQTLQDICSMLVENGEEVNMPDKFGRTPVFECVNSRFQIDNCLSYLHVFSEYGANLNAIDKNGANILMTMLKSLVVSNNLQCVLEVLDFLSSVSNIFDHKDNHSRDAIHYLLMAEVHFASIFNGKITQNLFKDIYDFVKSKMS